MMTTRLPSHPARGRGCRKRERYRAIRREKMSPSLDGIRVIDFTHDQAGPSCTQMLAWLGADVIKIERPPARRSGTAAVGDAGRSGRQLFLSAAQQQQAQHRRRSEDCRGQGYRAPPGQGGRRHRRKPRPRGDGAARAGLRAVKVLNPRAVYASVKGFGSYDPYSAYKCFEPVAQATSGAMSVTGEADGPPLLNGANIGDSGKGRALCHTAGAGPERRGADRDSRGLGALAQQTRGDESPRQPRGGLRRRP